MTVTLIEGLHYVDNFPSWGELCGNPERHMFLGFQAHNYMKCFLFRIFDKELEGEGLLCQLRKKKSPLRPLFMIGVSGNVHSFLTCSNLTRACLC